MHDVKTALVENRKYLLAIFITAITVRLLFSFYLQQYYFGELTFKYKDTASYLNPFLNLIEHGVYQGDLFVNDSKYFRVPVYPLFLGFIHVLFGADNFDYAVATIQSIIDSFSALLVFLIILRVSKSTMAAVVSAMIYATYPFILLWVPISYTEVVQTILMWLLIAVIVYGTASKWNYLLQGALCGLLVMTKQYLGLLIFIPLISIAANSANKKRIQSLVFVVAGMVAALSPWVIRNYIDSGTVIVLRGETTGFRSVGSDFEAFWKFASLFDENITPALYDVSYKGEMQFDKHPEFVNNNRVEIDQAIQLAYQCGDSFVQQRTWTPLSQPPYDGCEKEVALAFNRLTEKFWQQMSFIEALETRFDAVAKIVTKSDITNKKISQTFADFAKNVLFKYRVLILLLGCIGLYFLVKTKLYTASVPIIVTALAMYFYFTVVIVHAEMRYLLVPDLLISMFAGVALFEIRGYVVSTWRRA